MFNRQKKVRLELAPLRRFAVQLAERMEADRAFSIVLVSDAAMRLLNRRFLGKDRPTDVLSFPDSPEDWEVGAEPYAGDVIISVDAAQRQRRGSLLDELKVLSLHGLLHLLGYDHETDDGEMRLLERKLKKEFHLS